MNNTHYYLQIMEPMFLRENSKKKKNVCASCSVTHDFMWVCVNVLKRTGARVCDLVKTLTLSLKQFFKKTPSFFSP